MLDSKIGNRRALLDVAERAYLVAQEFENIVSKEWIVSYLNDDVPIDALSYLSLKANNLHKDNDIPMFSVSHSAWLTSLRVFKFNNKKNLSVDDIVINNFYDSFKRLQELSMKYTNLIAK